jgi:gas vesicle protein
MFGRQSNLTSFLVGGAIGFISAVMLANRNGKETDDTMQSDDTAQSLDNMIKKIVLDEIEPTDSDTKYY